MARNKYPEKTRQLIVDTAAKLFIENGYEQTSIQDIINQLGGLSKGAIYHHFKSKEDIMEAVSNKMYADVEVQQNAILSRKDLSGKEKIRELFRSSLGAPGQREMFTAAPDFMKNPRLLATYVRDAVQIEAPDVIRPILEEGIADGSIQTEYPRELAEVLMLLANIWLNPMVYYAAPDVIVRRMQFFQDMLKKMGMDIIEDDMIGQMKEIADIYLANREKHKG